MAENGDFWRKMVTFGGKWRLLVENGDFISYRNLVF